MTKTSLIVPYDQFVSSWRLRHIKEFGSSRLSFLNSVQIDYEGFCKLADSIRSGRKAFVREKMFSINYLTLGEIQKIAYRRGASSTSVASFNRKEVSVGVFREHMFSFMLVLRDFLIDQNGGSSGLGLPGWLKHPSIDSFRLFSININSILRRSDLAANIMYVPKGTSDSSSQLLAIKAAKLKTTKQCLEHCRENSPGEWLSYFKDEESFSRAADRLLKASIEYFSIHHTYGLVGTEDAAKVLHKKHRINKRRCEQFLRYLAYISSMSVKLGRPIELLAEHEAYHFNSGYKILREAAQDLGWLVCIDDTYCVGVRCMTFQSRVCIDKKIKTKESEPRINDAESKILKSLSQFRRSEVSEYYGEDVVRCAEDRKRYVELHRQLKALGRNVQSSFGSHLGKYSECGKDVAISMWTNSGEYRSWMANKKFLEKLIEDHRLKYSRPRQNYRTSVHSKTA